MLDYIGYYFDHTLITLDLPVQVLSHQGHLEVEGLRLQFRRSPLDERTNVWRSSCPNSTFLPHLDASFPGRERVGNCNCSLQVRQFPNHVSGHGSLTNDSLFMTNKKVEVLQF